MDDKGSDLGRILNSPTPIPFIILSPFPHLSVDQIPIPYPNALVQFCEMYNLKKIMNIKNNLWYNSTKNYGDVIL